MHHFSLVASYVIVFLVGCYVASLACWLWQVEVVRTFDYRYLPICHQPTILTLTLNFELDF